MTRIITQLKTYADWLAVAKPQYEQHPVSSLAQLDRQFALYMYRQSGQKLYIFGMDILRLVINVKGGYQLAA